MAILRWALVVPLGVASVLLGFLTALVLRWGAISLCPDAQMISGLCTATWYPAAEAWALSLGSATGASSVVLLPSLVAPRHRVYVGATALVLGAAYATWFLFSAGSSVLLQYLSALVAGVASLWLMASKKNEA